MAELWEEVDMTHRMWAGMISSLQKADARVKIIPDHLISDCLRMRQKRRMRMKGAIF
jgi:hypothetical protein